MLPSAEFDTIGTIWTSGDASPEITFNTDPAPDLVTSSWNNAIFCRREGRRVAPPFLRSDRDSDAAAQRNGGDEAEKQ